MLTTILFDLDGTLLPMDQEVFVKDYLNRLAAKMVPYGYDPQMLVKAVWRGTGAMVANDGRKSNEAVFWETFADMFGQDALEDVPLYDEFYETEFQECRHSCGNHSHPPRHWVPHRARHQSPFPAHGHPEPGPVGRSDARGLRVHHYI